ncbi:hypothetical protein ES708_07335 [subsurface metagenome]
MKNMKKSILIAIVAIFAISFTNLNLKAQSFEQGDIDVNFQIGFGTVWYYSGVYKMGLPLISLRRTDVDQNFKPIPILNVARSYI